MYDSQIGRWMIHDPYQQFASPYIGMGNNPVNGSDPDGGFWQELKNRIFHGMWISDSGLEYLRNTPNSSYVGWEGNRLKGYAKVYSIEPGQVNTLDAIKFTSFNAVQDYTYMGLDVYLDFDFNVTAGLRLAALVKGVEGFDLNMGSVNLLNYNFIDNKWSRFGNGNVNYSTGMAISHGLLGGSLESSVKQMDSQVQEAVMKLSGGIAGVNLEIAVDAMKKQIMGALTFSEIKLGAGLAVEFVPKIVAKQHVSTHIK